LSSHPTPKEGLNNGFLYHPGVEWARQVKPFFATPFAVRKSINGHESACGLASAAPAARTQAHGTYQRRLLGLFWLCLLVEDFKLAEIENQKWDIPS